jgi:hypothetical protein
MANSNCSSIVNLTQARQDRELRMQDVERHPAVVDLHGTQTPLGMALSSDYAARQRVSLVGQQVSSIENAGRSGPGVPRSPVRDFSRHLW